MNKSSTFVEEDRYEKLKNSQIDSLDALMKYLKSIYGETLMGANLSSAFSQIDQALLDHFWKFTIKKIQSSALSFHEQFENGVPVLQKRTNEELDLTRKQCKCLMANFLFCTFTDAPRFDLGFINFIELYVGSPDVKSSKLRMILSYFLRAYENEDNDQMVVTFRRYFLSDKIEWSLSKVPLCDIMFSKEGTIEDEGKACIQIDFANKMLGGGVLGRGAVQEEIRFCINPELFITKLVTQKLDDLDSLCIFGVERFSDYSGYSRSLVFKGEHYDNIEMDNKNRRKTIISAIDAIHFYRPEIQFRSSNILREINKAHIGFTCTDPLEYVDSMPIATGNWGCGAFRGDKELKLVIQWIAASQAKRNLYYFTFGDDTTKMNEIYEAFKKKQLLVKDLVIMISKYEEVRKRRKISVLEHLQEMVKKWHEK